MIYSLYIRGCVTVLNFFIGEQIEKKYLSYLCPVPNLGYASRKRLGTDALEVIRKTRNQWGIYNETVFIDEFLFFDDKNCFISCRLSTERYFKRLKIELKLLRFFLFPTPSPMFWHFHWTMQRSKSIRSYLSTTTSEKTGFRPLKLPPDLVSKEVKLQKSLSP